MSSFFITGTDTGVGKTEIALALMTALQARGLRIVGMKPVASGCAETTEGLRNEDAVRLQRQSSLPLTYELVNPYAFAPAIAPHLAAAEVGVRIDLAHIKNCYAALAAKADAVVVEGVGGLLVPLSEQFTLADLVKALDLPVVLVVGLRLGCLNHALLTAEAIERRGLRFAGWVANGLEPEMDGLAENVLALTRWLPAPFLGLMPYHAKPSPSGTAFGLDVDAVARI